MKRRFTLIEVVVAVGILMAVMGVAAFAFAGVQNSWRTASRLDQHLKQCQLIDRVLDNAVRNAVPFHWKDRNNKESMLFVGGENALYLTYLHRIGERDTGGIRFLRLYVAEGKLIAEYRPTPILSVADVGEIEVLAENVKRMTFQYADLRDDRLEWYSSWDPEEMKNLPVAILLTVDFADGASEVWLRRTAGNSRAAQLGNRLAVTR